MKLGQLIKRKRSSKNLIQEQSTGFLGSFKNQYPEDNAIQLTLERLALVSHKITGREYRLYAQTNSPCGEQVGLNMLNRRRSLL